MLEICGTPDEAVSCITEGSTVMIGSDDNAVVFDWYPTILAGEAPHAGPRGTDVRLEARLEEMSAGDFE